ncbi:MAG: 50S ribosomal protein L21 [Planctomycetota bacterium]
MQAIFVDGGRQYRVEEGMTVDVDYRQAAPGSVLEFSRVLAVAEGGAEVRALRVGEPVVSGAKVVARVVETIRGPKLIAATYRRRKESRRRVGHRQKYTRVKIESIQVTE